MTYLNEQDEQALLKGTRQAERAQIDDCERGREQQGIHLDAERSAASKGGGRGDVSRAVVLHRFCWLRLDEAHEGEQDGASYAQQGSERGGGEKEGKDSRASPCSSNYSPEEHAPGSPPPS